MAAGFGQGTVTSTSPLKIVTDIDPDHPVPARTTSSYAPTVGDRVRYEILTPYSPRILGRI